MKRIISTTLLALFLSAGLVAGCGEIESSKHPFGYRTDCVRGVVYYQGGSAMAPAYKQDGTLYLCESN